MIKKFLLHVIMWIVACLGFIVVAFMEGIEDKRNNKRRPLKKKTVKRCNKVKSCYTYSPEILYLIRLYRL